MQTTTQLKLRECQMMLNGKGTKRVAFIKPHLVLCRLSTSNMILKYAYVPRSQYTISNAQIVFLPGSALQRFSHLRVLLWAFADLLHGHAHAPW